MEILIVGVNGSFGRAAKDYFIGNGHRVSGIGRNDPLPDDCGAFDACILAIPVTEVEKYTEKFRDCPLIEISSTKDRVRKFRGKIISIHPMFGPRSIGNNRFHDIIFITDISPVGSDKLVATLFPGFNIVRMTADEHDKAIADLLVKPYVFSLLAGMLDIGEYGITCTSFNALHDLAEIAITENSRVLEDTIRFNPHTREILVKIREESGRLLETLGEGKNFRVSTQSTGEKGGEV